MSEQAFSSLYPVSKDRIVSAYRRQLIFVKRMISPVPKEEAQAVRERASAEFTDRLADGRYFVSRWECMGEFSSASDILSNLAMRAEDCKRWLRKVKGLESAPIYLSEEDYSKLLDTEDSNERYEKSIDKDAAEFSAHISNLAAKPIPSAAADKTGDFELKLKKRSVWSELFS